MLLTMLSLKERGNDEADNPDILYNVRLAVSFMAKHYI